MVQRCQFPCLEADLQMDQTLPFGSTNTTHSFPEASMNKLWAASEPKVPEYLLDFFAPTLPNIHSHLQLWILNFPHCFNNHLQIVFAPISSEKNPPQELDLAFPVAANLELARLQVNARNWTFQVFDVCFFPIHCTAPFFLMGKTDGLIIGCFGCYELPNNNDGVFWVCCYKLPGPIETPGVHRVNKKNPNKSKAKKGITEEFPTLSETTSLHPSWLQLSCQHLCLTTSWWEDMRKLMRYEKKMAAVLSSLHCYTFQRQKSIHFGNVFHVWMIFTWDIWLSLHWTFARWSGHNHNRGTEASNSKAWKDGKKRRFENEMCLAVLCDFMGWWKCVHFKG